jgi:hypothetical protein
VSLPRPPLSVIPPSRLPPDDAAYRAVTIS